MKPTSLLFMLLAAVMLVACGPTGEADETPPVAAVETPQPAPAVTFPVEAQPDISQPMSEDGQPATAQEKATSGPENTDPKPAVSNFPAPTEPAVTPIEITYFTPGQGEGPYYPLEKPNDRDNDLTTLKGASGVPAGEVLEFSGKVYDATGLPVEGALIEIWQTDANGIYLHPDDPDTNQRDPNFQFYGESITGAGGSYSFRTVLPGRYEPRPRHIHVKVKLEGRELLTTQFYFAGDPELAGEVMFNQAGSDARELIISFNEGVDANNQLIYLGRRDIILNVDLSGS